MASLTPEEISKLVQAASDAAQAASSAAQALRDQQQSRSSASKFHEASKVVRQPDPFGSEVHDTELNNWQDCSTNFRAWLFYANPSFELDLHRIEVTHADQPIVNVSGESAETQDRCSQLYSVLTGLLRGKPLRMLNGFEVWRQLVQLFQPKTKSRAISTLSALMNIPGFTQKDRTLLDQILGLERLRAEYVRPSGSDIADDIMLSVLVRALPKAIQQHIQLQMNESSTYAQVRSLVVGCEKTTTSWSTTKVHNGLGILPVSSSVSTSNYGGVAPMEVDRFEKGKSKGKQKGKSKSKDPQKGKGKSKNDKGKGKGGKPSQRSATSSDQENLDISSVIAGSFMANLMGRPWIKFLVAISKLLHLLLVLLVPTLFLACRLQLLCVWWPALSPWLKSFLQMFLIPSFMTWRWLIAMVVLATWFHSTMPWTPLTFQLHVHIQSVVSVLILHIQTLTMIGLSVMTSTCCPKICMRMFAIFTASERLVFQSPKSWRWYWIQGLTAQSSP